VHDNAISGGGDNPGGRIAENLAPVLGKPMPAILYDGVVDPAKHTARICVQNNGGAEFVNYDAANGMKHVIRNARSNNCALPPLQTVAAGFGGN